MNFNVYYKGYKSGKKRHDENTKKGALGPGQSHQGLPKGLTYKLSLVEQEDVGMGKAWQALHNTARICSCVHSPRTASQYLNYNELKE